MYLGYENEYQVSNLGRIKRKYAKIFVVDMKHNRSYYKTINEKIISQFYDGNGYKMTNINGKRVRVHRIVANAFLKKIKGKDVVNHIDGNKSNNNVNNLEWVTTSENIRHAIKTGLMDIEKLKNSAERTPVIMINDNLEVIKKFNSIQDAYRYFGLNYRGAITEVCQGKRKHFKGYRWKYDI